MALKPEAARLSKLLVDSGFGEDFEQAQRQIDGLTLEIVVGDGSSNPAAHAAVLTAVSVGGRCFGGGVRVTGRVNQPVISALPVRGPSLADATADLGARPLTGEADFTVVIGRAAPIAGRLGIAARWGGWMAGVRALDTGEDIGGDSLNPLAGVAAGALGVAAAFDHVRGQASGDRVDVDLWGSGKPPMFSDVLLPGAIWIIGLGNLGQAFLWALGSLPYADPAKVLLHVQDFDRVTAENWGTSVLVEHGRYGALKNKVVEDWIERRGFDVRRIDRRLLPSDRIWTNEPTLAFSGVDKIGARRDMAGVGFKAIIDAGLGRTAGDFDKFRVNVFEAERPIDRHFADVPETKPAELPANAAYEALEASVGRCGAAEIGGASVAVPHVSALATAMAVSRAIALISGQPVPFSEIRRTGGPTMVRQPIFTQIDGSQLRHAGRPFWPR